MLRPLYPPFDVGCFGTPSHAGFRLLLGTAAPYRKTAAPLPPRHFQAVFPMEPHAPSAFRFCAPPPLGLGLWWTPSAWRAWIVKMPQAPCPAPCPSPAPPLPAGPNFQAGCLSRLLAVCAAGQLEGKVPSLGEQAFGGKCPCANVTAHPCSDE